MEKDDTNVFPCSTAGEDTLTLIYRGAMNEVYIAYQAKWYLRMLEEIDVQPLINEPLVSTHTSIAHLVS